MLRDALQYVLQLVRPSLENFFISILSIIFSTVGTKKEHTVGVLSD